MKKKKRGAMEMLNEALVSIESGVDQDFRGKPGRRQVTVLSKEAWNQVCEDVSEKLEWTVRRANLFVSGLDLENSIGKKLVIGDLVMEITGETDPCKRMDEQHQGLFKAMESHWRGGVCCQVIESGRVQENDTVRLVSKINTHE